MFAWTTWVFVTAVLHVGFAVAEIFAWVPLTPKLGIFNKADANTTKSVGMNMGVYNAIVAACLFWLWWNSPNLYFGTDKSLATLLLGSVIFAGLFGGATIKWTIPLFQSLPAAIALYLLRS